MIQRFNIGSKIVFAGYLLFFLLLFLQLPLNNAMPGSTDSFFNMALFNSYGNQITAYFTGEAVGTMNYPEGDIMYYGETSFLSAAIYLLFKWMQIPDLWSFYLFYAVVFALNAFTLYLLLYTITNDKVASIAGGIIFPCLNFTLAQLDHQNALIFFPIFLAAHLLMKQVSKKTMITYLVAGIIGGFQIFFSVYIFFMGIFLLSLCTLLHNALWPLRKRLQGLGIVIITMALFTLPHVYIYLFQSPLAEYDSVNPLWSLELFALDLQSLYRVLPHNLIYNGCCEYARIKMLLQILSYHWHAAFIGFLLPLTAIIGAYFIPREYRLLSLALLVIGLLFAFGPYYGQENAIYSPMYFIYQLLPILKQFSHVNRFFFLALLALTILSTFALSRMRTVTGSSAWHWFSTFSIVALILIENIPFPLVTYHQNQYKPVPEALTKIKEQIPQDSSILFLPAYGPKNPEDPRNNDNYLRGKRNAYQYMYWQTKLKKNVANGNHGNITNNRIALSKLINPPQQITNNIQQLKSAFNLKYITYCKEDHFSLQGHEVSLSELQKSDKLQLISEDERIVIFEIV